MAKEISDDHSSHHIGIEIETANETGDHLSTHGGEEHVVAKTKKDEELAVRILGKLRDLTSVSSKRDIFKVPEHLRSVNHKDFEPCMLAIGPYHRDNKSLMGMEEHKKRYLKELLERRGESELISYVAAVKKLKGVARTYYAESIDDLGEDDFVEMMVLDGCFILELLRKFMDEKMVPRDRTDDAFIFLGSITKKLGRDLLLVENQLPFCVLEELFRETSRSKQQEEQQEEWYNLRHMILKFFGFSVFPDRWLPRRLLIEDSMEDGKRLQNKHLLSFMYDNWLRAIKNSRWHENYRIEARDKINHFRFMRCATELKDAGIRFRVRTKSSFDRKYKKVRTISLFDIKFKNGIMKIPRLEITGETESIFRNLIAYEQLSPTPSENRGSGSLISDYMKFMDCLINSQEDVKLLCKRNILHNCLGDDEMVAKMFNRFADFVTLSPENHYSEIFVRVNKHCGKRRYHWIAKLRHKYVDSPWAFISICAAILLLLLTLAQTVFSALAYYK